MATKKTTTRKAPKTQQAKAAKKTPAKKAKAAKRDGKLSAIDAAAKVLGEAQKPMNTKAMIEAMAAKKYWTSPGGKTPHATLYSAILREIQQKGKEARFTKTERGHFTLGATANAPAKPAAKAPGKKVAQKKAKAEVADGTPGPKAVSELFKI